MCGHVGYTPVPLLWRLEADATLDVRECTTGPYEGPYDRGVACAGAEADPAANPSTEGDRDGTREGERVGRAMLGTRYGERDDGASDGERDGAARGGDAEISELRTLCIIGDCGGVRSGVGGRIGGMKGMVNVWAASLSARRTASEEEDTPIASSAGGGGNLQNAIGIPCDRQIGHSLIRSRLVTAAPPVGSS